MKLSQLESRQLEKWAAGQLDDMGVSNPSVLGKLISSLVNENKGPQELKKHCISELKVFLKDGSADFVEFLFDALEDGSYRTGIEVNENSDDDRGYDEDESESRSRDRHSSPPPSEDEDERRPRGRDRFESFDNVETQQPAASNYVPSSSAGPRTAQTQGPRGQFQPQAQGHGQVRHNPTNPSGPAPRGQPRGPPFNNYNNNPYNAQQQGYPPRGGFNSGQHNVYPPHNQYPQHQPYAPGATQGVAYNKFAGRGEPHGPRGAPVPRGPPQINDTATYNPYAMPILPQLQPQYQFPPAPVPAPNMMPIADPNVAPGAQVPNMYPQYAPPPAGVYMQQQGFPQDNYYPAQSFAPQGPMNIVSAGPDGQQQQQLQEPTYGYIDNTQHQPAEPAVGSKRSYGYDQPEPVYPPPQPQQEQGMFPVGGYAPVHSQPLQPPPMQQLNAAAAPYIPGGGDYSHNVYEAQHPPPPVHQAPEYQQQHQQQQQHPQGGYYPPPPTTAAPGGAHSYGSAITSTNYHHPAGNATRPQKGNYLQEHERVTLRAFSVPVRYTEDAIRQHFEEHGHVVAIRLVNKAADDSSIPHYKKTYTECLVQYYSALNAKKRLQDPRTVFDNPYISLKQWFVNIIPPAEVVAPSDEVLQRDAHILQHGPIRTPPQPRHQSQGQGFNKFTTSNKYRRTSDSDPSVPSSNASHNINDTTPLELDANGDFPSVGPSYATSSDPSAQSEHHSSTPSYAEVVVGAPAEQASSSDHQHQEQPAVKVQAREALDSLKTLRQQAEEIAKKKEAILMAQVEKCRAMVDELEQTEDSESRQGMLNNLEAKILALQTQLRGVREQQSERAAEALAAAASPTGSSGALRPPATYPPYHQQQQPYGGGRGGRGRGRFNNSYPYPTYPAQPGGRGFYRGRGGGRGRGRGRGRFGGRGDFSSDAEAGYEGNEGGEETGDSYNGEGGGDSNYYEQGGAEDGGGDYSEEH